MSQPKTKPEELFAQGYRDARRGAQEASIHPQYLMGWKQGVRYKIVRTRNYPY